MNDAPLKQLLGSLLEESVTSAISREQATFDSLAAPFERRIVLHGAGGLGLNALNTLRANGIEPLAFSDGSPAKWGRTISGLTILSPEDAAAQYGQSAAIVVTISSRGGDFLPIASKFAQLGCQKVVHYRALFWKFPESLPSHLFHDIPSRILTSRKDILEAYNLLTDFSSREEFVSQLHWRLWLDFNALKPESSGNQYFPEDIFPLGPEEVFVDAGAYDGDTLKTYVEMLPKFERYIAIEPDPTNFADLRKYVLEMPLHQRNKIECKKMCVGARKETLRFAAAAGEASQVSDKGDLEVDCDTLDEICSNENPTIIKMDIEGAEVDALCGSHQLLARGGIIWAVCVYHQPEHLWQIPLLISKGSVNYRFFIRKYAGEIWETVCYAVPRTRLADSTRQR